MASAGLDKTVNLWDIRKFGSRKAKPVATQFVGRSANSAMFSPSGASLLTTSMGDTLDLLENAHHQSGTMKPNKSIRHNNQTGRWLTTLMAQWHPQLDIFVSGSLAKPRCVESFDSKGKLLRAVTGESLTSVMSRCCYHPSTQKIAMIGGNSSGRVVVLR
jgi:WD40 repeat protein